MENIRPREDFVRDLDVLRAGTSRCPVVRSRALLADYDSALARIEELEASTCPTTDTPEQALRYLDTVMFADVDDPMRRGAYNRVSLHIKEATR